MSLDPRTKGENRMMIGMKQSPPSPPRRDFAALEPEPGAPVEELSAPLVSWSLSSAPR